MLLPACLPAFLPTLPFFLWLADSVFFHCLWRFKHCYSCCKPWLVSKRCDVRWFLYIERTVLTSPRPHSLSLLALKRSVSEMWSEEHSQCPPHVGRVPQDHSVFSHGSALILGHLTFYNILTTEYNTRCNITAAQSILWWFFKHTHTTSVLLLTLLSDYYAVQHIIPIPDLSLSFIRLFCVSSVLPPQTLCLTLSHFIPLLIKSNQMLFV